MERSKPMKVNVQERMKKCAYIKSGFCTAWRWGKMHSRIRSKKADIKGYCWEPHRALCIPCDLFIKSKNSEERKRLKLCED